MTRRRGYHDYAELTQHWDRYTCTVSKQLQHRLIVVSKVPGAANMCGLTNANGELTSDHMAIANPYMFGAADDELSLIGYWPVTVYEDKGGVQAPYIIAHILVTPTLTTDRQLHKSLGSQLQTIRPEAHLLDLSSDSVITSGQIERWSLNDSRTVDVRFGTKIGAVSTNAHELINALVTAPNKIETGGY